MLKNTKFGRYTYAIGGNETAARLSGVRTSLTKASIYAISGLLAAIAGILVMGRLESGAYQNGTNLTLMSVAAVVIGGTVADRRRGRHLGHAHRRLHDPARRCRLVYLSRSHRSAKEIMIGTIIVLAVLLDTTCVVARSLG